MSENCPNFSKLREGRSDASHCANPENAFFLQLFVILVYNILTVFVWFPFSDETTESIKRCSKNINRFLSYLSGCCTSIRCVHSYVRLLNRSCATTRRKIGYTRIPKPAPSAAKALKQTLRVTPIIHQRVVTRAAQRI